ncbi:MAG: GAF domain-containing protein, partial [Candidatus Coatesbacteria bacterium]|nr:GAF domain-containing protein [Candidatus Coatesbacteria bacterium]
MSDIRNDPELPECWEIRQCKATECPLYGKSGVACWLVDNSLCEGRGRPFEDRFLMICSRCPAYLEVRKRAEGRRIADKTILATFDRMVNNLYSYHISLKETNRILAQKISTLRSVQDVSEALLGPFNRDEVLYMVLTALTAGEGFGFNRAFLFLADEVRGMLSGELAVGPSDHEEATRIWGRLSDEKRPLKELLRSHGDNGRKNKISKKVRAIEFPIEDRSNVLVQSLLENRTINVPDVSSDERSWKVAAGIETEAFAVFPLVKDQRRIGAIVVDNFVTRAPILDEDLEPLAPFTSFASIAIDSASLHDKLQQQVVELGSAHKRLRSQRQIIARSEQLAEMGRLTADLAHEIRNPMTLIGGFARVLSRKLPKGSDLHKKAEIIVDEITRLEALLTDALKIAKDEKPRLEPENVNFLVMEVLNLISSECKKQSIRVIKKLDNGLPTIMVDRYKLKEVLINLLQNAMQSMPDGGIITVASVQRDGNLLLEIADTGVGIEESELDKIFNPFYTSRPGGTGLGLSLANRIIEMMSGRISVESRMGQGSKFTLMLPLKTVGTGNG